MKGLPDRHHCPECGFAYSRDVEVIPCGSRTPLILAIVGGIGCLGGVGSTMTHGLTDVWSVIKVIGFGSMFITYLLQVRRRRRTVLDDEGIVLIGCDAPVTRFTWRDIDQVEYARLGGGVRIIATNAAGRVGIESEFFGSDRKVRTFVASANEWLARYRGKSEGVDEPTA